MPTLDWIGKKAVLNHHNEVPFHLLRCNPELSVGEVSGNLLVQGDNLLALKALLPYYAGQVKCIYIDPPYNTGNEGWVYNDNVNSPEMREWLGKVVGNETEDLSRHDKWLCMMYPRMVLLREMLSQDGAIIVSIDENEVSNLKLLMDEVFGGNNLITIITWQKRVSPANDAKYFSSDHEFLLIFAKSKVDWKPNRLKRTEQQEENYKNPDNDPRGPWNSATYTCNKSIDERPNLYYGIENPNTGDIVYPKKTAVWRYNQETHLQNVQDNLLFWGMDGKARMPRMKKFLSDAGNVVPRSIWSYAEAGHTQEARTEILQILGENPFITPKPSRLIRRVLEISTNKDDLILDSFAGSGTTGHAVMQTNRGDGGNRRFILIEMDRNIAQNITAERLRRISQGYNWVDARGSTHNIEKLGDGFRFCELGPTMFDSFGQIRSEVSFADLARHVFFTETGQPLPGGVEENALLGTSNGSAVYLLYNGVMRDSGNVLTPQTLAEIPFYDGPKIIYADGCKVSRERLRELGITFKQIPYEIKVR
ncbi:MAG TPA: site-specific DNA-methyltransferase [Bellilinea sp.]|nr:site-specific DNA-methyltransferase [Bellilinea sp.]